MRFATASCVLATATSVIAMIVVNDPGRPQFPQSPRMERAYLALPEVEPVLEEPAIEERQVPGQTLQQAATPPPTQYPSITTMWFASNIPAAPFSTYVSEVYTQVFVVVPQQWPSPGVGEIGYGTLKDKRDDMPMVTPAPVGIAEIDEDVYLIVLQLETAYVTQPIQRVTEVLILETRTVSGNMTCNGTLVYGPATGHGTGFVTGTAGSQHTTTPASLAQHSSYQLRTTGSASISQV